LEAALATTPSAKKHAMALFSRQSSLPTATPTSPAAVSAARDTRRGRLGWIVAASLATGVLAALLLVFAPFTPVTETAITGAVLCGFAIGWVSLLLLSERFTDQPQRWAAVPAMFMGAGGLLLWVFGSTREALSWIWPPALLALVVWMVIQVRRDLRSRGGRVQLYAVFAILALCAIGGGWQTVSATGESNPFLASGRLVTVDGHQLRLKCTGSGAPTVILEPGAGGTSADMSGWVAPALANQTRTCVYDRAGRGGSQPAATAQDGAQIATDLHSLLHRAGVPGPYVLAGHSFGGLYVRVFAAHYPNEVAGLVLLDSTASSQPAKSVVPAAGDTSSDTIGRAATLASLTVPVGIARLYGDLVGGSGLPARYEDQLTYDTTQANTVRSVADEYMRGGAAAAEAASLRDFGDKPLYVLTAGEHPGSWMADQKQSASLSTNSVWRVVDGSSHQGLLQEEQYAAQTSRAVLDVVTAVRNHQPLTASR
jgi:pimeloyl-ACP methyl ester carboxylesterase